MSRSNATLYYRYGAYELKARYQTHLALSQMLVLILIGLGLTISSFIPKEQTVIIAPPRRLDTVRITIGPPPTIIKRIPNGGGGAKPPVERGLIPVPVDDSSADADLIQSRDELASMFDSGSSTDTGDSSFSIDTIGTDFFPDRGVFVSCDSLPVMIRESTPEYPSQAIQVGLEGRVTIQVLVDKEGVVRDAAVLVSSGVACFDEAAVKSGRLCRYRPAIQNGHAIAVWVTYPVVFRLR